MSNIKWTSQAFEELFILQISNIFSIKRIIYVINYNIDNQKSMNA